MNLIARFTSWCFLFLLSVQSISQSSQEIFNASYASLGVDICSPIHDNLFRAFGVEPVSLSDGLENRYYESKWVKDPEYIVFTDSPNFSISAREKNGIFYVSSIKIWLTDESLINKCNFQSKEISLLETMAEYQKKNEESSFAQAVFPERGIVCQGTYQNIWHKRVDKSRRKRIKEELKECGIKISRSQMLATEIIIELDNMFELKGLPSETCVPDHFIFKNFDQFERARTYLQEIDNLFKMSSEELKEKGLPYTESDQRDFYYTLRKGLIFSDHSVEIKRNVYGLLNANNAKAHIFGSIVDDDSHKVGKYYGRFIYGVPHGHVVFIPKFFDKVHARKVDLMFNYGVDVKYRDTINKGNYKLIATVDKNGDVLDGPAKYLFPNGIEAVFTFKDNEPIYERTIFSEDMYYEGEVDENFLPHGRGEIKFHPLSWTYRNEYKSISGIFKHGKPIKENLYTLDFNYYGDIDVPLDDNFLPHSPEKYSVKAVSKNAIGQTYYIWTNYIHGKPQTLAIKMYEGDNFIKEYVGKAFSNLRPSSDYYKYENEWDDPDYKYKVAERQLAREEAVDEYVDNFAGKKGFKRVYDINTYTQNGKTYVVFNPHKVTFMTVLDSYNRVKYISYQGYIQEGGNRIGSNSSTRVELKKASTNGGSEKYTNIGVKPSPEELKMMKKNGVSEMIIEITPDTPASLKILAYSY